MHGVQGLSRTILSPHFEDSVSLFVYSEYIDLYPKDLLYTSLLTDRCGNGGMHFFSCVIS